MNAIKRHRLIYSQAENWGNLLTWRVRCACGWTEKATLQRYAEQRHAEHQKRPHKV